jgi:hypothetical protein
MAEWENSDSCSSDAYDDSSTDDEASSEPAFYTRWMTFRAVGVKTARVYDERGGAKTVVAAIAIASSEQWRRGAGGDAVVFYSLANGGRLVANGGLSGAPNVTADDLANAPDLSDVVAAAVPLLRGNTLVAHQPGLVLRLLGLDRSDVGEVVDLSAHSPSFKAGLVEHLHYGDDCTPARWCVTHTAVAALQLAFMFVLPNRWGPTASPLDMGMRDYSRALQRHFGPLVGWVSFSALAGREGCPMPGWLGYSYPELFSTHLFHLFELHHGRQHIRLREMQYTRRTSDTRRTPTSEPAPAPPPAPPAPAASPTGEYEAALVGHLSGAGWVSLRSLGREVPRPHHIATPLGRFINARPELFRRDGNFVSLVGDEDVAAEEGGIPLQVYEQMQAMMRWLRPQPLQRAPQPPGVEESDQEPPLGPDENDKACSVCMSSRKVGAFVPCMHRCCCMSCGNRVMETTRQCPICRRDADMFGRVYD